MKKLILALGILVGSAVFLAAQSAAIPPVVYKIVYTGADPEGAITKPIGWLAIRTDNGGVYSKTSGTGNTGWTELAAGAGIIAADIDTSAELRAILGDESGTGAALFAGGNGAAFTVTTLETGQGANELFDMDQNVLTTSNVQFAQLTLTSAWVLPDNVRMTFNPGANAAGINFGCQAAAPDTPSNGDAYCDSDDGKVYVRAGGAWVEIVVGGGTLAATDIDTCAELAAIMAGETGTCGSLVFSSSPTLVTPVLGVASATTLDTGQGANELYDMDQNVLVASSPTFAAVTVATEVYGAGWDDDHTVPDKDALFEFLETFIVPDAAVATWLATPSIANFYAALTGEASGAETFLTTASVANFFTLLTGEGAGISTAFAIAVNATGGFLTTDGTATLTGKTLDCEATGNVCQSVTLYEWTAGVTQAGTASVGLNLPTSNPCAAVVGGDGNAIFGGCAFDATTDEFLGFQMGLPGFFNASGVVSIEIDGYFASATADEAAMCVQTTSVPVGSAMTSLTFDDIVCVMIVADATAGDLVRGSVDLDVSDFAANERAFFVVQRNPDESDISPQTEDDDAAGDFVVTAIRVIWRYTK